MSAITGVRSPRSRRAFKISSPSRPGERQVEQNRVERVGRHLKKGVRTGPRHHDVVALAQQPVAQGVGNFLFILDNQETHDGGSAGDARGSALQRIFRHDRQIRIYDNDYRIRTMIMTRSVLLLTALAV